MAKPGAFHADLGRRAAPPDDGATERAGQVAALFAMVAALALTVGPLPGPGVDPPVAGPGARPALMLAEAGMMQAELAPFAVALHLQGFRVVPVLRPRGQLAAAAEAELARLASTGVAGPRAAVTPRCPAVASGGPVMVVGAEPEAGCDGPVPEGVTWLELPRPAFGRPAPAGGGVWQAGGRADLATRRVAAERAAGWLREAAGMPRPQR
jgi:hypothetical protein